MQISCIAQGPKNFKTFGVSTSRESRFNIQKCHHSCIGYLFSNG